jgi:hypothetical protein
MVYYLVWGKRAHPTGTMIMRLIPHSKVWIPVENTNPLWGHKRKLWMNLKEVYTATVLLKYSL